MLKEGLEIRDYELKKFLGRGGFGEVWLAEKKIEITDKRVAFALKFLSGDSQRLSELSSVRRELNTWIDASGNKNIVSVLDGFIHENMFVIVSEYANNGSLRDWMRKHGGKSPNLETTVEILSGVLDGLSHLHAQKIVHRDLKPENILLKGDVPCIADFGVSRMVETVSLTSSQLGTNSAGSPLYMSPESFERTKPVPQVDIWSAGVILFEMLSGKTPYSGDTIPALIFEIVTKEPRSLPAYIPQSIRKVVHRALTKDVSERFSTAKEMRDALMKALYSQDSTVPSVNEDLILTQIKETGNNVSAVESAKTLLMDESFQDEKPKETNKKLVWAGIGTSAILAASIGYFTLNQSTVSVNSNQSNNSTTTQTITSETNSGNNNSETKSNNDVAEKTSNNNVNIATEKIEKDKPNTKTENVIKPNVQTVERQTSAKPSSIQKKETPKATTKTKKPVTLKDLINEP